MNLKLVSAEPPSGGGQDDKVRNKIPAKQLGGVENPATVLLHPVHFNEPAVSLWSFDGILLGGIKVNGAEEIKGTRSDSIWYLPTPVPRSWGQKKFNVVVEYECEHPGSIFQLRLHYGCGDPSELHRGETGMLQGRVGAKSRERFELDETKILRNELFRASLEIVRVSPKPVLVYGAWLEVGV